jgi:hypothetical protein
MLQRQKVLAGPVSLEQDRPPVGQELPILPVFPHTTPFERVYIPPERTALTHDLLKFRVFQWDDNGSFVFNGGHAPEVFHPGLCDEEHLWLIGQDVHAIVDLQERLPRVVSTRFGNGHERFYSEYMLGQLDKQIKQTNVPQLLTALDMVSTLSEMTDEQRRHISMQFRTDALFQMRQNAVFLHAATLHQELDPAIVENPLYQPLIDIANRNLLTGIEDVDFAQRLHHFSAEQQQYAAWCAGRYHENPYTRYRRT